MFTLSEPQQYENRKYKDTYWIKSICSKKILQKRVSNYAIAFEPTDKGKESVEIILKKYI
jgi:hypothetical protein